MNQKSKEKVSSIIIHKQNILLNITIILMEKILMLLVVMVMHLSLI